MQAPLEKVLLALTAALKETLAAAGATAGVQRNQMLLLVTAFGAELLTVSLADFSYN